MKILITGAAGFIGSNLIKKLNREGYQDLYLVDDLNDKIDNSSVPKWHNLRDLIYLDYYEYDDFLEHRTSLLEDVGAVIHMGAISDTTIADPRLVLKKNYRYSVSLAELALERRIHFIYASSAATYGNGVLGFSDDHSLLETFRPLNLYAYSKHLVDLWCLHHNVMHSVTGFKFFNVYGPQEYHKGHMSSVILKLIKQVVHQEDLKLFKSHIPSYQDGEQRRDFIYIDDVVNVLFHTLVNPFNLRGIFNLGTGISRSFNDIVNIASQCLLHTPKIKYIPMPENIRDKYQYLTVADMTKFHQMTDDEFKFMSLETGISKYIQEINTECLF